MGSTSGLQFPRSCQQSIRPKSERGHSRLVGSASAPTAVPTDGTYWFDLASSSYGLFEWSATNQSFTTITPTLITSTSDLVGGVSTGAPKTSIGVIGDYAINTTHVTNKIYKKTASNTWVQVGSTALAHIFTGGDSCFRNNSNKWSQNVDQWN